VINTGTALAPPNTRIDLERDFTPIILFATGANVLTVRANSPLRSVKELIAAAKAKPGSLTYGTSGVGSSNHFSGELLALMGGIQLVHVPYKGNTPAITDAVGGQIDMVFAGTPTLLPFLKGGRLRALAIGSRQRFILLPEVPTFDESGLPGYEMPNFFGFSAPAGTPRNIVMKINRDTGTLLRQAEIVQQLQGDGLTARGGAPEDYANFIRERRTQLAQLIKAVNIRPQ
jgi:tripartite-type tricarboxylate transporter receptor subunit TctC